MIVASVAVMRADAIPPKLNFGCGYDRRDGYLNVDSDPACKPDLLLVGNDLSCIPREHFEEVLARDVLEHIPRAQSLATMLEWADMLIEGGRLVLQTSSVEGVAERLTANPTFAEHYAWTQCLFGTQAHPGDYHYTGFTHRSLHVHLLAAGFRVDGIWIDEHWLLGAQGTKVLSWTAVLGETSNLSVDDFLERAFEVALGRAPDWDGAATYLRNGLRGHLMSRRDALKHLMSSPERLFKTAERNGL